jgi:hypothetical protein
LLRIRGKILIGDLFGYGIYLDAPTTILGCDTHFEPEHIDSRNIGEKDVDKFDKSVLTPETIIELFLNRIR